MYLESFTIILIIIIIYYIYMELCEMKCEDKIYMEKLLNNNILKTGDLILFKSTDNSHSFLLGNYFTHVGMVIVDEILTNNEPYIFEACNTKYSEIPHDREDKWNLKYSKGILFHPLDERLKRYRGYLYYKPLSESITIKMHLKLINFIFYALLHFCWLGHRQMFYGNVRFFGRISSRIVDFRKNSIVA